MRIRRSVILLGMCVSALALLGVAARNGALFALALPLLVYLAVGAFFAPGALNFEVERLADQERHSPDQPVELRLRAVNRGEVLDEVCLIEQIPAHLPLISGAARATTHLESGAAEELEYAIRAPRGRQGDYALRIEAVEPLGLFESGLTARPSAGVLVRPVPERMRPVSIRPRQTRGFSGPIPSRTGGAGVHFFTVREYQPGDPQRQINWKASARRDDELFTNLYERDRVADVGLILDARWENEVRGPGGSLFEHSVRAAATLARSFLNEGNRVGMLVYGGGIHNVQPGYGKMQLERILAALARVVPAQNYALNTLEHIPARFFPPGSQIVLISSLVVDDRRVLAQLVSRGYSVMVICPDPLGIEVTDDHTSPAYRLARVERALRLAQARRAGADVVEWRLNQPLEQALRAQPTRRPPRRALGFWEEEE